MSVSKSYLNSDCDVYRMNDNIVTSGVLTGITDTHITVTDIGGNIPPIKPQTLIKVSIKRHNSQSDVFVGLVADAAADHINVSKLQRFNEFDKREYFRLNIMLNSRIQLRDISGILTETVIPVKVRDLSLRGIFFVAKDDSLLPGQELDILLTLSETYSYTCTIRRKVDYYRSIGYGCSFNELDSKQEDCLCSYLFEQQRKEILRAKNQML